MRRRRSRAAICSCICHGTFSDPNTITVSDPNTDTDTHSISNTVSKLNSRRRRDQVAA
jgi:hypothetical protein